jgi:hypothetical protein
VESSTTRLQRFLRGSVACLLTANGFALAVLASDGDVIPDEAPAAADGTRTITVIRTADGQTQQVDPNTVQGRAAIEEAEKAGATITTVTVPPSTTSSTTATTLASKRDTPTLLPNITLPTLPITVPTLPVTIPTVPTITIPTVPTVTVPTVPPVTVPTVPPATVPPSGATVQNPAGSLGGAAGTVTNVVGNVGGTLGGLLGL